jgi:TATA element modulatory factor
VKQEKEDENSPTAIENDIAIKNNETALNSKNNNGTGSGSLSGNASSNEEGLETCVSSDIEVLSLPSTTNGDNSKITKSISSTYTKINKAQLKSPTAAATEEDEYEEEDHQHRDIKPTTIQAHANNMHSQLIANSNVMQIFHNTSSETLVGNTASSSPATSIDALTNNDVKKIKYLLEAREAHILKLNKQNVKLQEDNDNLLSDLEKLKIEHVEKLKSAQFATDLKQELAEMRGIMAEKDQQIEELRQEGLKLSKQELNHTNIIKKLRAKEKESEEVTNSLRNELKKKQKDLSDSKELCVQKDGELEQMKRLEKAYIQLDKESQRKQMSLDELDEKCKSLENNLQNAYKELAELHKLNAVKDVKINEKVNTQEIKMKQEIELAIEKEKSVAVKKQEALKWELESVRSDLARVEQQHSLREGERNLKKKHNSVPKLFIIPLKKFRSVFTEYSLSFEIFFIQ